MNPEMEALKPESGMLVYDSWWPWRLGKVIRVGKTRLRVRWMDETEASYDRPHMKFLRQYHGSV